MRKPSKLTTAVAGSVLGASVISVLAIRRYLFLRNLKKDLDTIPWETYAVTWKHYFKSY